MGTEHAALRCYVIARLTVDCLDVDCNDHLQGKEQGMKGQHDLGSILAFMAGRVQAGLFRVTAG